MKNVFSLHTIKSFESQNSVFHKQNQKRYMTEVLALNYDLLESRATIALRENSAHTEKLMLEGEELPF